MTIKLERTRFVCVSDTHNASPLDGAFKLPKGDVLIHAGDLTKQGTLAELRKILDWIENADFERKLVVAGNHDITLDSHFYTEHGRDFHNQYPQNSQACIDLIKQYSSITYLNHETVDIQLQREDGPKTSFRVFGSPYSPANGHWAFGYSSKNAIWDGQIPLDTDIVITHTPPKYHCDESKDRGAAGCEMLRQKLWRVRPLLAICGHVHEGRGAERVTWDLETPNVRYKELTIGYWTDLTLDNKKQSLIDLSSRSPLPLDNTGSWGDIESTERSQTDPAKTSNVRTLPAWRFQEKPSYQHIDGFHPAIWGQGGGPPSGRCDNEALACRLNRRETCIVNAAIMASSWPYKSREFRRFNKPIVVDIDLPVRPISKEDSATKQQDLLNSSLSESLTMSSPMSYSSAIS